MYIDLLLQSAYFLSAFLFILALGGLSHQESARKGNYYGIFAMTVAIAVTFLTESFHGIDFAKFGVGFAPGGIIGLIMALRVLVL
jgi:NAD(P) transhydrogenase subunit beta